MTFLQYLSARTGLMPIPPAVPDAPPAFYEEEETIIEAPDLQCPEPVLIVDADRIHDDRNARKARQRATIRGGPNNGLALRQYAEATLGGGSLRKAVKLPEGEDEDEWLAVNSVPFPKSFPSLVRQIFKRMYRVYAHIYCHHYAVIRELGLEPHLNTSFKQYVLFVDEHKLDSGKDFYGPLSDLAAKMIESD
ncbi:maintenance of ploidy protein mob1 [Verticillium alfalfae VaMs.102]|uniref:Maintenance of ploidy protein mob1 n=1 Tax=Verticillium alfalfae (strain VaMs.102 / ATCC MYA-4576 / FGSC 10136) TaxID=526221 RepID=C9SQC2_VERA1|nr:maintenance of ploidy protein mob1 [Verticillium alfalfae VaMs.102]EEY21047.1 maintenance of ploidy protein mob1 [Verticillium alfalfae VaMs.102]